MDGLTESEKQLLANGNKIGAIASVRERLGCSLSDAKKFVEDGRTTPTAHQKTAYADSSHGFGVSADSDGLNGQEIECLSKGSMIEAIRLYHVRTGKGLKESKEAFEKYLAGNPHLVAKYKSSGINLGGFFRFLVIVIGMAIAYLYLTRQGP